MPRKIKIVALFVFFIAFLFFSAYIKIRHDIPKRLGEALNARVSYQVYKFNIFRGFEFIGLDAEEVFHADTVKLLYLIPSIFEGNILNLKVIGFRLNLAKLELKKGGKRGTPSFAFQRLSFRNGTVTFGDELYIEIEELSGYLAFWGGRPVGKFDGLFPLVEVKKHAFRGIRFSMLLYGNRLVFKDISVDKQGGIAQVTLRFEKGRLMAQLRGLSFAELAIGRMDGEWEQQNRAFSVSLDSIAFRDRYLDWASAWGRLENNRVLVVDSVKLFGYNQFVQMGGLVNLRRSEFKFKLKGLGVFTGYGEVRGKPELIEAKLFINQMNWQGIAYRNIFARFTLTDLNFLRVSQFVVNDPSFELAASGYFNIRKFFYDLKFDIRKFELSSIPKIGYGTVRAVGKVAGVGRRVYSLVVKGEADSVRTRQIAFKHAAFEFDSSKLQMAARELESPVAKLSLIELRSDIGLDTNRFFFAAYKEESESLKVDGIWSSFGKSRRFSVSKLAFSLHNLSFSDSFPLYVELVGDSLYTEVRRTKFFGGELAMVMSKKGRKVELTLSANDIDFEDFQKANLLPFKGILSYLDLKVAGNIDNPSATLWCGFRDIDFDEDFVKKTGNGALKPFEGKELTINARYSNGYLFLNHLSVGDGAAITATGKFPLSMSLKPFEVKLRDEEYFVSAQTDSFAIDILKPFVNKFLVLGEGSVRFSIQVEGKAHEGTPSLLGWMAMSSKEAVFLPTNSPMSDFRIDITLSGDTFYIDTMIGLASRQGYASGKGVVYLVDGKVRTDINIQIEKFPLYPYPGSIAIGDGTLKITGQIPGVFIVGDIFLEEAHLNMPFTTSVKASPNPVLYRIHLSGDRNIFIYNPNFEMELSLDIVMSKEDEIHSVTVGELDAISGKFYYLDRTFDIVEGKILLTGGKEFNPDIYIKADGIVCDTVLVTIVVSGTFKQPEVEVYSEPPMDKIDIISLIAFGKPLSELQLAPSDVELVRQRVLTLAEGLFSRELRKALSAYGISVSELSFQVDPWRGTYAGFTIGFRPSRNMLIRYTYDSKSVERYTFQVKYFVKHGLAVYGERDRFGEVGAGIEFELEF